MKPLLLLAITIGAAQASVSPINSTFRQTKTGLDVLIASNYSQLASRKVLLLTNPTGVTPELNLGVDVMFASKAVNLVGILGPEHGFRGTSQAGAGQATFVDPKTGLTVYNAYNANTSTLVNYIRDSGADLILYDIQDVGARFYTYIWALYDIMVAANIANTSVMVLDRPNPIAGNNAFGPVLNESFVNSYVGRRSISQVHGMTVGELAKMYVGQGWIAATANAQTKLHLEVVTMQNWRRSMRFEDTGLPWVLPSPNMPTVETAMIYGGACLFEGTNMSEGRGSTRPFELLGAPWANESWADAMRSLHIPHTNYRFQCFTPTTSKFSGENVCGLQVYVELKGESGRLAHFDAPFVGVSLLYTARKLFGNGSTLNMGSANQSFGFLYNTRSNMYNIDVLAGSPLVRESLERNMTPEQIRDKWTPRLNEFRAIRKNYLLYE
ncbi:hypothetical protein BB8028_0003g01290 [Beauveria bassiana]|uniref:Secreted protein n=1 Tax=Beauveria bassiana TaxID=176275 RepID=A0A2S7Y634_BEABA|nr:hypothetical protein BB8028_0003g01290 [Beauveria bassiana]